MDLISEILHIITCHRWDFKDQANEPLKLQRKVLALKEPAVALRGRLFTVHKQQQQLHDCMNLSVSHHYGGLLAHSPLQHCFSSWSTARWPRPVARHAEQAPVGTPPPLCLAVGTRCLCCYAVWFSPNTVLHFLLHFAPPFTGDCNTKLVFCSNTNLCDEQKLRCRVLSRQKLPNKPFSFSPFQTVLSLTLTCNMLRPVESEFWISGCFSCVFLRFSDFSVKAENIFYNCICVACIWM